MNYNQQAIKIIKEPKLPSNFMEMRTEIKLANGKINSILATISTILVKIISNRRTNGNL